MTVTVANPKPSLLDFRKSWDELVTKAFDRYDSLSKDERVWFNVQCLIDEVNNGGIAQFYFNHCGAWAAETIEDLLSLGFDDIAAILSKMNRLFPDDTPPADIEERNAVISAWPDDGRLDSIMRAWDEIIYAREVELEQRLIQHIKDSGLDRRAS